MQKVTKRMQRRALRGWKRWIFVVVVAFSPLFMDAWLNIKTRHQDYVNNFLNAERQRLNEELEDLSVNRASLERLDRLSVSAEALGLREPEPAQVQVIQYEGELNSPGSGQGRMLLAQRSAQSNALNSISYEEDGVAKVVHSVMVRGATVFQSIEDGLGSFLDAPAKVEASELPRENQLNLADTTSDVSTTYGEGANSSPPSYSDNPNTVDVNVANKDSMSYTPLTPENSRVETLPTPLDAILEMPKNSVFTSEEEEKEKTATDASLDESLEAMLGAI